jgi:uncharacterized protein (TIGR03083 family)
MTDVDWVGEYRAARARIAEVVRGIEEDERGAATPVPACPDWTVRDLLAHLTGMAAALGSGSFPSGDVQAWLDELVASRQDRTVAELLDEWERAAPAIEAFLAGMGAGGGQLVYDVVAHEHDLRMALGRPGARDSSGVVACSAAVSMLLERDLEAAGLPAVRITSGGRTWDVGTGEPELAVALEPFELIRVFGSRRSEAQLRAIAWQGDLDRYLPGLAHMPLPDRDLVE